MFHVTFKKIQLTVIRERITSQEQRLQNISTLIGQANHQQNFLNGQLLDAKTHDTDLRSQLTDNQKKLQQESQTEQDIASINQELQKGIEEDMKNAEEAKSRKATKDTQLKDTGTAIDKCNEKISTIDRTIQSLDASINSPEPQARYNITPGTCIHGHVNCPNLPIVNPGRSILLNGEEIEEHKKKVNEAREEKIKLLRQRGELLREISELKSHYSQLDLEVLQAQTECWQYEANAREKQQRLADNKEREQKEADESQSLAQTVNTIQNQLLENQENINKLLLSISVLQDQIVSLCDQQQSIEAMLLSMKEQARSLEASMENDRSDKLEAIARRHLRLEQLAASELVQENPSRPISESVKGIIDRGKEIFNEVKKEGVTTITDFWPTASGLATKAIFKRVDEIVGLPSEPTGNIFIDNEDRFRK